MSARGKELSKEITQKSEIVTKRDYPDIYILDQDQPATCPKCGARTDFAELGDYQVHTCKECGYSFVGEFEE